LKHCFKFENNCSVIVKAQFKSSEEDKKGRIITKETNWLIAGIKKEIHLIDMDFYLDNVTD